MNKTGTEEEKIKGAIARHKKALESFDTAAVARIAAVISAAYAGGKKVLICGNGGSSSDSQHFAGELVGRFKRERRALPAITLNSDTAVLTCISNDYGYDRVFERQVRAHARPGDVFIGISTSGNSENVLKAARAAKEEGAKVVGFFGQKEGKIAPFCDEIFRAAETETARIQEMHILAIHMICELVEEKIQD